MFHKMKILIFCTNYIGNITSQRLFQDVQKGLIALENFDAESCLVKVSPKGRKYNGLTGHNRNESMAKYADAVILFEGGSGTEDMRRRAKDHSLKRLYDCGPLLTRGW